MFLKKSYSKRVEKNNKCNRIKSINALMLRGFFYVKTNRLNHTQRVDAISTGK